MNKDRIVNTLFIAAFVIGAGLLMFRAIYQSGPAPEPAIFQAGLRLEEAMLRAKQEDKPVLVFASATWCGPCQSYKRAALVDPRVEEWVGANAIAVHVDVDEQAALAGSLGVQSIPVTMLIRNQREVGRLTGEQRAEELLAWLTASAAVGAGAGVGAGDEAGAPE